MAIQFARARYISRSSGGSAIRSAAYNAREAIEADRTGAPIAQVADGIAQRLIGRG